MDGISTSFRSHLTSIKVPIFASYLNPCPYMSISHPGNIAPPPWPRDFVLIIIHVLRFASQHHPVYASHASMSQDFASPPHPGLKTCTSPPSRSCPTCIQDPRFASGLPACASHFYMDLTTFSVPRIAFPSRSHPTYIQVSRCVSPPTRSCLTSIQVPISTSHLHPGQISTPIQVKTIAYHFHPGPISPSAKTWYSCLISSQVSIFVSHHSGHISPHLHSANCISASTRSHLITSRPQDLCLTSIKAPFHSHPYLKICISPASRFHLICTQVPRFSSDLSVTYPLFSSRQDCILLASRPHITPSRFLNLCLASMQVTFHLHPGPDIRVTSPFRSHLGSIQVLIQVPRIASQLHPSPISPHQGQKTCVSPPSKYHLTCIRVPGFTSTVTSFYVTSHLHSGSKNHSSPLSISHTLHLPYQLHLRLTSIQVVSHLHPELDSNA